MRVCLARFFRGSHRSIVLQSGAIRAALAVGILLFASTLARAGVELTLSWSDNSDNESGFEVERSSDGVTFSSLDSVAADLTSYVDSTVLPGLTYQYRVRAFNDFGYSAYTNVAVGDAPNTAPVITVASAFEAFRGAASASIPVTVSDQESDASSLAVEVVSSSNATLVPLGGLALGGSGAERTLTITPVAGAVGSSDIALAVSDGVAVAYATVSYTVLANTAPTISSIASQQVMAGMATSPIAFTVADAESDAAALTVSAVAADPSLIADGGLTFNGAGAERSLTVLSRNGVAGSTSITISITDGGLTTKRSFTLTVKANAAPTISAIADQSLAAFSSVPDIAFTIGDAETAAGSLTVTVSSSNEAVLPASKIAVSGTGANRALSLSPIEFAYGEATVSVRVGDGANETVETFLVAVAAPTSTVDIRSFRLVGGNATIEVESQPNTVYTLWKSPTLAADSWAEVSDALIAVDSNGATLIDPIYVEDAAFYRVKASVAQ